MEKTKSSHRVKRTVEAIPFVFCYFDETSWGLQVICSEFRWKVGQS